MKLTLDHNCIIDLIKQNTITNKLKLEIDSGKDDYYVVDIGASEMLEQGIRPDRYDLFEALLTKAGLKVCRQCRYARQSQLLFP